MVSCTSSTICRTFLFVFFMEYHTWFKGAEGGVIYKEDSEFAQNQNQATYNSISGEIVEVEFLRPMRRRRDTEDLEFHYEIIEIRGGFGNQTVEMHVTVKSLTTPDFKVVVKEGDVIVEEHTNVSVNCLYTGVLKSDPTAKVAISSCGQEDHVSGLVVSSDGDWMIEPLPVTAIDTGRTMESHNNHHRIRRAIEGDDLSTLDLTTDQLHVPKAELEAAAKLAREDAKAAEETNAIDVLESATEKLDVMNVSSRVTIPLVAMEIQTREDYILELEPLVNTKVKAIPMAKAAKKPVTKASTSNVKEVVEIAVFTDPDFYDEMKIRYPKDTNDKVKEYILTVVNAVDLLYEQKSLGTELIFKLVHLEIMKTLPSKLKKNGKSAKDYLTSFCQYAGDLNLKNAMWDHALLLTGSDLKEGGSSLTAGLAWAGTMCYRYYSCSVSEALQLGAVYVIAHELGHSLGMDHDGSGTCKTCDADKFLMSPTTGTGKVTWSSCSSKNLKDFIKEGSPELRGSKGATPPVCLTSTSRESTVIEYKDGNLPGQKFDAKKQCQLSLGKKFTPHMTNQKPFNAVCSMLYCANTTHATTTHAALEGTECASGKMCRGGQCVKS